MTIKGDIFKRAISATAFEAPPRHIRSSSFLRDVWNHLRDRWRMWRGRHPINCEACIWEHAKAEQLRKIWANSKDTYVGRRFLPYGKVD